MTLAKGILKSTLYGLLTGGLLAITTLFWMGFSNPFLLPVLVAIWWLIIFSGTLLHVYRLSNYPFSNTKHFGLQVVHATVAAGFFWAINFATTPTQDLHSASAKVSSSLLQANISSNVQHLLTETLVIVPAAFILCIITSGLLFSILTRPSSK